MGEEERLVEVKNALDALWAKPDHGWYEGVREEAEGILDSGRSVAVHAHYVFLLQKTAGGEYWYGGLSFKEPEKIGHVDGVGGVKSFGCFIDAWDDLHLHSMAMGAVVVPIPCRFVVAGTEIGRWKDAAGEGGSWGTKSDLTPEPYYGPKLPRDTPADRARRRRGQASMDRFLSGNSHEPYKAIPRDRTKYTW